MKEGENVCDASQCLLLNLIDSEWFESDSEAFVQGTLNGHRTLEDSTAIEVKEGGKRQHLHGVTPSNTLAQPDEF